jgi:hypothetical protein
MLRRSSASRALSGHRSFRSLATAPVMLAMLVLTASCSDSTAPEIDDDNIRAFFSAVGTTGGASASYRSGEVPTGTTGPVITISGTSSMIPGGSTIRSVSSTEAFSRIIVAVTGTEGYWELNLPASVTTQQIILTLAQELPQTNFNVRYAGGTSGGVGTYQSESVAVVSVGTGQLQVSVSWNSDADVDLYLVEPNGEEIYYGNSSSAAGGQLDLDSNAGCSTGPRNENITYSSTPPSGTYTVRLNYWDSCGASSTNWVVTVQVAGRNPTTHTGTFTGAGVGGGSGAGQVVTTFTR